MTQIARRLVQSLAALTSTSRLKQADPAQVAALIGSRSQCRQLQNCQNTQKFRTDENIQGFNFPAHVSPSSVPLWSLVSPEGFAGNLATCKAARLGKTGSQAKHSPELKIRMPWTGQPRPKQS
ncbi:hypothetical protein E4U14_007444 [Claviceps sp. LM454 group G7]|nr:hypothetical protein E4U14_007444 [Claviceps sp. LM454 group G7]